MSHRPTVILEDAEAKAKWLLDHYDELPNSLDLYINEAVKKAKDFIDEVKAIESESAEMVRETYLRQGVRV